MLQKPKIYPVEFDGVSLFIKTLSIGERLLSMEQAEHSINDVDYYVNLLMKTVCNKSGTLLFTTKKDREELLKMPIETLFKFFTVIVENSVMEDKGGTASPTSKKK